MRASGDGVRPAVAILAELGGAIVGGVVAAPIFGYGAGLLLSGAGLGMGLLAVMAFAALVGAGAGAGLGAGLAGRLLGQGGSTWRAAALGAGAAALLILVVRLLNINLGGLGGILAVGAPLVLAAAVIGYNLRRGR